MTRNKDGGVLMECEGGAVTAVVPQTRSALGIIATNGLINGAEYRDDGMVYFNGTPIRKWHVTQNGIRLWEPKLKDLPALYDLYKRTQAANENAWKVIQALLDKMWGNHKKGDVIKAHAKPYHHFVPAASMQDPWWEYCINDYGQGLSFGFQWLDEKPKRLINPELGQKLYILERRWYENTCRRAGKVRTIFYDAMKSSLPKATENKVICLQFGDDTFWFHTLSRGTAVWWEMFNDRYSFEVKRVV